MIDHVVVDVEIQKTIEETPGGWDATDKLGVACAVVYEFATDRFRIFGPDDVEPLRERLLKADKVSGFNIWAFDFPVIWAVPRTQRIEELRPKTNDLLRRVWQADRLDPDVFTHRHRRYRLEHICRETIGAGKIGHGAEAPKWFQAGQWAKVANYCADDVALERDLAVFADRHGYVVLDNTVIHLGDWSGA